MVQNSRVSYKMFVFLAMAVLLIAFLGLQQVTSAQAAKRNNTGNSQFGYWQNIATPTATPTAMATPANDTTQNSIGPAIVGPFLSTPYYVNIATGSDSNTCKAIATPCQHIQEAINKAIAGDVIYVTSGTYLFSSNANPNVVTINKNLTISGGWNPDFTSQNGMSTIDGANTNNGILAVSGTVNVENFVVKNSKAYNGGAVYIVNGSFSLTRSTLMNNIATQNGAGIFMDNGTLNLVNSTLSGNTATSGGGGIYVSNNAAGSAFIQNSTIAYNTAGTGGGIRRNNGIYNITNSIIANNSSTVSGPDCAGIIAAANYNIIEDATGCSITGGSNNLNVDPAIENSLSGSVLSHALMLGSPAIDAGTSIGCPSTDQLGLPRPLGESCDIGSIEYMDYTPIVLTIMRVGITPTFEPDVVFAVTFSEAVTGVDINDFILTTSGVTGVSINSVSGSGSSYTVSVHTGTGSGTIRLDLISGGGIVDGALNPLSNSFTGGEVYTITKAGSGEVSTIAYADLVFDAGRGRLYGADLSGNKIDVIDATSLSILGSYTLAYGSAPLSLDLSPNGNELAIAQSNTGYIAFINLLTGSISQLPSALSGSNTKVTDVLYGRSGILYAFSSNGLHVVDLNVIPHVELTSKYVYESSISDQRFGAISSDKNTLYLVAGSCCTSAYTGLNKYDISGTLIKPTLLKSTHLYETSDITNIRLDLIDDENLLITTGSVYNTSGLTPKAENHIYPYPPSISPPGKSYYVTLYDNANAISDMLYFYDNNSSHKLSSMSTDVIGTQGAIETTSNGNVLFVSSTGGMSKFNLSVDPPGMATPLPESFHNYNDFVFDIPRGLIYGTDVSGRIDVIDADTADVVDSYLLPSGANPIGIDLSPNGSELAVALNGLEKLLFINPETGATIAEATPQLSDSMNYTNLPFDVVYGRDGRLYSDGNPGSGGTDYLHVINTLTHQWIAKSAYPMTLRTGAELVLRGDKQYIYANETFSPNSIYVLDARTDAVVKLYKGVSSEISAHTFTVLPDGSKIFTSAGQVWDGTMQSQMGSLEGAPGNLIKFVPNRNVLVVSKTVAGGDALMFISAVDYHLLSTYIPIPSGEIKEFEVAPDGSRLIMNIDDRIRVLSLDPAIPSNISIVSGGSQAALLGSQFSTPLKVQVKNYLGQSLENVTVTFTAPANGASGVFEGSNTATTQVMTDYNGIATAPAFFASGVAGSYKVAASTAGLEVLFSLANIDPIPYVTYSMRTFPDPTAAASVEYKVAFSEAVTGVDAGDFYLTTSGVTGASVSTVTGSGSIYYVKVNTGSGNGTIRLNVRNDAGILNTAPSTRWMLRSQAERCTPLRKPVAYLSVL